MEWNQFYLNTFIPQLPKMLNDTFSSFKKYMDVFYDETKGIIIKPVETVGRIKGDRGEFVTAVIDNLTVRNQFTNLYENYTTVDSDFVTAYNESDASIRIATSETSTNVIWPLEPSTYKWIDINKPYYKINNDVSIAFNTNNIGQEFQIILNPTSNKSFNILMESSIGGQHYLNIDPSNAKTTWLKFIAISYDASYGPTWALKQYGNLDSSSGTGGGPAPDVDKLYVDGSLAARDISINWLSNNLGSATKVGTGQTYTTLGAAITAGKKLIEIVSNLTEIGNITLTPGTTIFSLSGRDTFNINMGNYYFSSCEDVNFNDVKITFSHNSAISLFNTTTYTAGNSTLKCNNVRIINNSTINNAGIAHIGIFIDCIVTLSNYYGSGFGGSLYDFNGELNNILFIGTGTSSSAIIQYNTKTNFIFKNLKFTGTFNTIETVQAVNIDGITSDTAIGIGIYKSLNNVKWFDSSNSLIDLRIDSVGGIKTNISNCEINNVSFITSAFPSFINCKFVGTFNSFSTYFNISEFINCAFSQAITFDVIRMKASNCTFNGLLTISANHIGIVNCYAATGILCTSDYNIINSNDVGSGGTSNKITFNVGADNNICVGNQTDAAIVNNGAGNQLAYNVVF